MADRDRDRKDETTLDDPLGIAGSPVTPDAPDRLRAQQDEESVRRRRARAGLGPELDPTHATGMGDINTDADGAAGIDMGYGGEGTNIKESGKR
jgi:hypothetical protein